MESEKTIGMMLSTLIAHVIHVAVHDVVFGAVRSVLNAYSSAVEAVSRLIRHRVRDAGVWIGQHEVDVVSGIAMTACLILSVPLTIWQVVAWRHLHLIVLVGPMLLAVPFHTSAAWWTDEEQRDRFAIWGWNQAAKIGIPIRQNARWRRIESTLETAWVPGVLLAVNIGMALCWPSSLLQAAQPAPGTIPGGRLTIALLFYPIGNALTICIVLILVGTAVAMYRAMVLNSFFRSRRTPVRFLLQIWPFPFLRFPKGMVLTAAATVIVALVAHDWMGRLHNQTVNNIALGLVLIAVYVWAIRVSLFAFRAESMYGPLTFFAVAGGVWITENFAAPGAHPHTVGVDAWAGLAINLTVAVAFTVVRVVAILSTGYDRAAAIARRGADDGPDWFTPRSLEPTPR